MTEPLYEFTGGQYCMAASRWKNPNHFYISQDCSVKRGYICAERLTIDNQGESISYIPCLRVAPTEVAWTRLCVPRAQQQGHRGALKRIPNISQSLHKWKILTIYRSIWQFLGVLPNKTGNFQLSNVHVQLWADFCPLIRILDIILAT